jgi:hypothetical protein
MLRLVRNTQTLQRIKDSLASPDFVMAHCFLFISGRRITFGVFRGGSFGLLLLELGLWTLEWWAGIEAVDGGCEHLGVELVVQAHEAACPVGVWLCGVDVAWVCGEERFRWGCRMD